MKAKKFRPTYREHSEAEVTEAIRNAIVEGGIFADVLTEICLDRINGATEFERGIEEGWRRLAGWLLGVARSEPVQMADEKVLNAEGD